jgi:hypothetical protein
VSPDGVHPDDMPDELDSFLDDLRAAAAAAPAPAVGDALATLFRDGAAPVVAPAPRRRIAVRAVVAGAVAGLTFGGLGVAGALPRPVQRTVADVVDHVGVHLPDARPATTTTSTTSSTVPPSTTTVPPTTVASTPTTTDDRGRGSDDRGPVTTGEEHGQSDDAPGRGGDSPGKSDEDHGKGKDDEHHVDASSVPERSSSGKGSSGRNPTIGAGVHVDDGPGSGHGNDGGTE